MSRYADTTDRPPSTYWEVHWWEDPHPDGPPNSPLLHRPRFDRRNDANAEFANVRVRPNADAEIRQFDWDSSLGRYLNRSLTNAAAKDGTCGPCGARFTKGAKACPTCGEPTPNPAARLRQLREELKGITKTVPLDEAPSSRRRFHDTRRRPNTGTGTEGTR